MKKIFMLGMMVLCAIVTHAQNSVKLFLKNEENKPLAGASATIEPGGKTMIADSAGIIEFTNLAAGAYKIKISHVGLEEQELPVNVPATATIEVAMQAAEEEEEEVIVTATRTSRSIADIPTRVETISGEELEEKGNMKPGEIRMVLNESTGIQAQQTSATSYSSSIRIQGLDGRYTQVLKDGFPLYAGFSGGLSLMQVTPLDLKQVEVIKGSSSTLYGGGAIAGLVNLVSKTPGAKRELSFLTNITSAKGMDLSGFYSQKFKQVGVTFFGSVNTARPYDPAGIGLTAIPEVERYTINPRFFVYGKKTNANIGFTYITEQRTGGSVEYIKHGKPGFYEKNKTRRFAAQLDVQHRFSESSRLQLKSSFSNFERLITIPSYVFEGTQQSSYSEFNFAHKRKKTFWIAGINVLTDAFKEELHSSLSLRNYAYNTYGVFVQNNWTIAEKFSLETGLRGDYVKEYGFEWLPRISALWKVTPKLAARLGGGLGYKTPTVFNEESERVQFQNILPINGQAARNEKSLGGSLDLNYRTRIGGLGVSLNQLFFITRLNHPLILSPATGSNYEFVNAGGYMDTKGLETNLKLTYKDFKLFIGYTYADVHTHFNGSRKWFPLTSKHRLNNVLMYELEEKLKIGLEAYYFSPQKLNDGATGKSYWVCGLMGEKLWKHFSVFINFENLFDTRQTRFDTIYTGTISNPVFRDIYAPVDGLVVNGGIKIKL